MQCRRCWLFGHTQSRCKNQLACEYCGLRGHSKSGCTSLNNEAKLRCINFKGRHESSSRICQRYQDNLSILLLAYSNTPPLAFKEAQRRFNEAKSHGQNVAPMDTVSDNAPNSYAAVAASSAGLTAGDVKASNNEGKRVNFSGTKTTYNYNPNGIILDRSELESLAFANMVSMQLQGWQVPSQTPGVMMPYGIPPNP